MRLRSHVLIIAAATLLPIIAVVCLAVVLLFQKHRNIELDRLVDTARALSLAVDRDFETGLASLRALATSQDLRTGDLRTFYDESKRMLAVHEGAEAILLVDPSGQQIINTRRPFGEALPRYGDPGFIEQVVTSRRPAISNLFIGSIVQRPVISLGVPVVLDGRVKYALTLTLSPSSLQQLLAQGAIAADSLASIIDGNKIIVARTRELDKFFGKPAGPVTIAHTTENHEGWWLVPRQSSRGVEPSYAAHRRSEFSGWTVVIGVPTAKVNAPFWQAFQFIGGGIVVLLGVALGLAAVFGRRITGSIAALAVGAKALGSGDSVEIASSPIVELDQVRLELETSGAARKRVEEKLRYELQLIRNITDSADECIFIADGDGDVKFANPAAVKTFGFGLHELLGQSLHATLHHSYVDGRPFPKSDCPLGKTRVAGATIRNHQDVFFRKDGSPVIVECGNAPVEIEGKRFGAVLIARDITEREQKEEALREMNLALAKAMPGISRLDLNGRYLSINDVYANALGYKVEELLGTDWTFTVHADDRTSAAAAYDVMVQTGKGEFEARGIRKDGSSFFKQVLMVKIVDPNGTHTGHHCFMRDITERKQAADALAVSEQSIRRLYAITNDTHQSFEERVRALLNLGCERFRMPIGSLAKLNRDHIELQFVQSSSDPNFTDGMMVPLSSSYCRSVMDADGPLCFEHVGASEWRNHPGYLALRFESYMGTKVVVDGEVYGTVCFMGKEPRPSKFTDADKDFLKLMSAWIGGELARRQAVQALRASHDELELRVEERTAELTRSNALLREKDQHLTLAQRAGHAGLWSRDLATGTSSMSPEWHELIGFPVDEPPVSFAEFLDRVHPDDRPRIEDLSLHQEMGDFDREFRIVHPVKGERWILSRGRRGISAEDGHLHMMGALIDITERKQTEEALRRSEERLQHALTVGGMGTWERDLRTGETKWDVRTYEMFDVEPGTPVSLDTVCARVHPDDLSAIKAAIANTERTGVEYAHEFRVIRTNGQIRWYHVSGGLRYDQHRNATHIAGINFDLTERKHAEEALRHSEERLQHALTVGSMGIWERNLRTGVEQWDRRTYEIFGIEAQTSVDLETFFSRIHPNDLPVVKSAFDRTQSTGAHYVCEFRVLKPDGKMIWLHANGGLRRDRDGTPTHIAGINFDITERRQAEEALRDSEARLRAILDHNPSPVFIKDTGGKYVHVNSRFEELFALHGTTSVGKTDADLFASEQAEAFQTNDRKVLDVGHAIQFEEVAQYFDGEHTSIVNKFPLRDGQGKIYALCGIATDITERKAAEEALHLLNEQLDQRVAQRTRELAESRARLRALVAELTKAEERERRRIAVDLHDYLAQSLTATLINLSRADKFLSGSDCNSELTDVLHDARSDLNNSINYTRTLIGELSPRVLYDLGLPAALGWLGEQMGRHGLSVEVDGPPDGVSLAEDDAVFLFQCARELLWNVVKHGDTNRATIAYGRDGNRVSLAVVDNGKGFDPQTAHANGNGGTQYGLFSIRERVELRGGRVEIDSAPEVGTWVSIVLPVDQSEEVSAKMVKPDTQQSAIGDAIKIVIVDDHKMVRQGLRRVLEEHDEFSVVGEAGDGSEAIAMARELEPHVVIMDVNLPTMSGIDATRDIVRERPSTIVIGLSFGSDSYVSQAMQAAGAVTCIAKERAVEDVRQAILDAMEGRWVGTAR